MRTSRSSSVRQPYNHAKERIPNATDATNSPQLHSKTLLHNVQSVAPHHKGKRLRAFALKASFCVGTIIGLANVSSGILEYLREYRIIPVDAATRLLRSQSYPAVAYVSSQSLEPAVLPAR